LEASAQSASAWYFPAILKAFLKSHASVRSAMRKFELQSKNTAHFIRRVGGVRRHTSEEMMCSESCTLRQIISS